MSRLIKTLTFVFVFAFLTMLSTIPTQAATMYKTVYNAPFISQANLCNSPFAEVVGNATVTQTVWDNDHFNYKLSVVGDIIDSSSSEKIGTYNDQERILRGTGDFPVVVLFNLDATCNGSGIAESIHFGLTIDENGNVHFHILN